MTRFLYDVFVYNQALGKTSLKFEKIRNLLREDDQTLQLSPFYDLMRMGLIDKVNDDSYGLAASKIFTYPNGDFSLGTNLPSSFLKNNQDLIHLQHLGLTIFKTSHWINTSNLIEFNLDHYTLQFQSIKKIINEWNPIDRQYLNDFKTLQIFDPITNLWKIVKEYKNSTGLYKRFIHNNLYFEYVLVYSNKYYSINAYETEKILFIRLALAKNSLFYYNNHYQTLSAKKGVLLPNFIYKTLFITHVLNTGEFPIYNQFDLNKKQVMQLLKPLKIPFNLI